MGDPVTTIAPIMPALAEKPLHFFRERTGLSSDAAARELTRRVMDAIKAGHVIRYEDRTRPGPPRPTLAVSIVIGRAEDHVRGYAILRDNFVIALISSGLAREMIQEGQWKITENADPFFGKPTAPDARQAPDPSDPPPVAASPATRLGWARDTWRSDPSIPVTGAGGMIDLLRKRYGEAATPTALYQIRQEVAAQVADAAHSKRAAELADAPRTSPAGPALKSKLGDKLKAIIPRLEVAPGDPPPVDGGAEWEAFADEKEAERSQRSAEPVAATQDLAERSLLAELALKPWTPTRELGRERLPLLEQLHARGKVARHAVGLGFQWALDGTTPPERPFNAPSVKDRQREAAAAAAEAKAKVKVVAEKKSKPSAPRPAKAKTAKPARTRIDWTKPGEKPVPAAPSPAEPTPRAGDGTSGAVKEVYRALREREIDAATAAQLLKELTKCP